MKLTAAGTETEIEPIKPSANLTLPIDRTAAGCNPINTKIIGIFAWMLNHSEVYV